MITTKALTIAQPTAKESALARTSSERLQEAVNGSIQSVQIIINGQPLNGVKLPESAIRLLVAGLTELGKGNALRLIPQNAELSTQDAAELLNLSRPYVVRLIDDGKIPSHKVGTHRRVRLDDVLAYKAKSDADRLDALKNLVEEAQELGMGYRTTGPE
jgi:excisionase family DNA binding protein